MKKQTKQLFKEFHEEIKSQKQKKEEKKTKT